MIFWINLSVAVVVTAGLMWRTWRKQRRYYRRLRITLRWLWLIPVSMLVWGFVSFIWHISYTTTEYNQTAEAKLAAIATDASVEGNFFLFSGTVRDQLTYRFFVETAPGEFAYQDVPAYRGVVAEGEGDPHVEYRFLCTDVISPWGDCTKPKFVFHVPEGSILRTYEMAP